MPVVPVGGDADEWAETLGVPLGLKPEVGTLHRGRREGFRRCSRAGDAAVVARVDEEPSTASRQDLYGRMERYDPDLSL